MRVGPDPTWHVFLLKKGTLGHTHRRMAMGRDRGEGGRLPAKERGLRRNQPYRYLDLIFLASRIVKR